MNIPASILDFFRRDKTRKEFYQSYVLQRSQPIIIDYFASEKMRYLVECPHLAAVIYKKAEMFANMQVKATKRGKDGSVTELENNEIVALIKKPNVLQSWESFCKQYMIYKEIYGNNFIYKNKPLSSRPPTSLWNLPSGQVEIMPTGMYFKQTSLIDIIEKYKLNINGQWEYIPTEEILYIPENLDMSTELLKGTSKIDALKIPISNIIGALKTLNCITYDRGALGILSNQSKDSTGGGIPMSEEERERIETQYRKQFGINADQMRTIITNSSLAYQSMTFPTKDLILLEQLEDDFSIICGTYGMDRDIFPSLKGATFENKKNGEIATYQSTIQPEADSFMRCLSEDFGLSQQGIELIADYSWLPLLQNDKQIESNMKTSDAQTIISLNASVNNGSLDLTAAIDIVVEILGYSDEQARKLVKLNPVI